MHGGFVLGVAQRFDLKGAVLDVEVRRKALAQPVEDSTATARLPRHVVNDDMS